MSTVGSVWVMDKLQVGEAYVEEYGKYQTTRTRALGCKTVFNTRSDVVVGVLSESSQRKK